MRTVARHDPTRYDDIAGCALREVLIAYEALLVQETRAAYWHDQMLCAFGGTADGKPIPVPPLLKRMML